MKLIIIILSIIIIYIFSEEVCFNFDEDYICNGNENNYEYPESWDERCFQTPPRNDIFGRYKSTYQDMHYLVGYAQLKYSSDKKNCNISFITKVKTITNPANVVIIACSSLPALPNT